MSNTEKKIKIGHTAITWPRTEIEVAAGVISSLGYHGIETFGSVLETLEEEGKADIFEENDIPLISSYFSVNIHDPAQRENTFKNIQLWTQLLKKHNTNIVVLGGDGVNRRNFNFLEAKNYMVDTVNEIGKFLYDKEIFCCFHPHTGTPVETEDEINAFMDSIDPQYVFFAPDVGQIQKGGADPIPIVNKYLSSIKHVHLKDYKGGLVQYDEEGREVDSTGFASYTPLGQGIVDIPKIMNILENADFAGHVMVELDARKVVPIPREEALLISKNYLENLGYSFVVR